MAGHLLAGEAPPRFADIRKIDAHSHVFQDMPELDAFMRENNLRTINVCNDGSDGNLATQLTIAVEK